MSWVEIVGIDALAQRAMCVEHFSNKALRQAALGLTLPSQFYSFELGRNAIRQRKQVAIMRSERVWLESVPERRLYSYIRLSNHRNAYLSRAEMT